ERPEWKRVEELSSFELVKEIHEVGIGMRCDEPHAWTRESGIPTPRVEGDLRSDHDSVRDFKEWLTANDASKACRKRDSREPLDPSVFCGLLRRGSAEASVGSRAHVVL